MPNEPPNDENHRLTKFAFFRRHSLLICIAALAWLPMVMYGAKSSLDSMTNDARDWLPEDFPETATIRWFQDRFGGDAVLVASWPGCTLNDKRLDQFSEGLLEAKGSVDGGLPEPLFLQVFSGRDTLERLTTIGLSRDQALDRMRGWLVGPDGTDDPPTCAVAFLSTACRANRHATVEKVYDIARSIGLETDELRLGGPLIDSVAIDTVSKQSLLPLLGIAILFAIAIAWACLRKVRFVTSVFFYAMFTWGVSLSIVRVCGINMDAVLITMPSLVYVLAVSAAVHMTGYYEKAISDVGPLDATARAVQVGWAPCMAAAVTTAFGVGSLMISEVVPVKRFGIFAAAGVMVAVVLLFVLWPSLIQCLISNGLAKRREGSNAEEYDHARPIARQEKRQSTWWLPFFHFSTTRWAIILVLLAVCIPVLGYGVSQIRMSVSLRDLFSSRSKVLQDYAWLESNIGPLIPVEVILRFPEAEPQESAESSEAERSSGIEIQEYARRFRDRAHMVERTRRRIAEIPSVGGTLAGTTFAPLPIPKIPTGRSIRSTARRGVIARQIQENRQRLVDTRFLCDERDPSTGYIKEELWRITGRVKALGDLEYASFLRELQHEVDDFLQQDETAQRSGVTVEVTGGVFLVAMAQDQLLVDLKNSFMVAFLLIALAMMVLTRSISAGVISMLPNVFPALLIFGFMGWLDVAVDIGTMMTASVALGIAVDDTSHFLTWLRRGLAQGLPRVKAIRYAYEQCATAMLVTSVICGLGILPFAFSPFMPVARFAVLMCVLLFAAIAGNLLLLAAALASPAGRLMTVERVKDSHRHGVRHPMVPRIADSTVSSKTHVPTRHSRRNQ